MRDPVPGTVSDMDAAAAKQAKWRELFMFLVLAVLIWPVIAVAFVATYGLAFWIWFMLSGPPGPH